MTKLTYQTALIGEKPQPIAVATNPIEIDTSQSISQIIAGMEVSILQNNTALVSALKKFDDIPDDAKVGAVQMILQIYRAFESGEFAMVSCHRYPCGDGTRDHCMTIRFTPPDK